MAIQLRCWHFPTPVGGEKPRIVFSPIGSLVGIYDSLGGGVSIHQVADGNCIFKRDDMRGYALAFDLSSSMAAIVCDTETGVYRLSDGVQVASVHLPNGEFEFSDSTAIHFSRNASQIGLLTDRRLGIWNLHDPKRIATIESNGSGRMLGLYPAEAGGWRCCACRVHEDLGTEQVAIAEERPAEDIFVTRVLVPHERSVYYSQVSDDIRLLVVALDHHRCEVWDLLSRSLLSTVAGFDSLGYSTISQDGRYIAQYRKGAEAVALIHTATGETILNSVWNSGRPCTVKFSTVGDTLAIVRNNSESGENLTRFVSPATSKIVGETHDHPFLIPPFHQFSPSGRWFGSPVWAGLGTPMTNPITEGAIVITDLSPLLQSDRL